MAIQHFLFCVLLFFHLPCFSWAEAPSRWWSDAAESRLAKAGGNRTELEKALRAVPAEQRKGMEFLITHMPDSDLSALSADFLIANHELAYKARSETPWGKDIPEEIFFDHVLPYANIDEKRDPWRKEFYELAMPIIKDCKTPAEAAQKLNAELFHKIKVKYLPQNRPPNLSPKESIAQGNASCTGLSILISDACRSVCIPARLVGTPNWWNKRGNHTWIEIWDKDWHFTGACEQDAQGLNRGWFVGDAAKAQKDSPEHAIYAASFRRTNVHFPLVWDRRNTTVPGENVTDRYAKAPAPSRTARVAIRVLNAGRKRVAANVAVASAGEPNATLEGKSRDESADLNDYLAFELQPGKGYIVRVGRHEQTITAGKAGEFQIVDVIQPVIPSADALAALKAALDEKPDSPAALAERDFAEAALTKSDAAAARKLIWDAHAAMIQSQRAKEIADRLLRDDKLEMAFDFTVSGDKPKDGRSLWISLHGGGGAPKHVNDQQWKNQLKLYAVKEGIYLAPRAPTDTWNLWHQPHIDRLFARLIEDLIVLEGVNPDRVYVMGYSAGGDGVYQLAPRMADRWAAAAMMAGHPNGVSMLSVRNVPFALQVGGNDAAYSRNKVGREYGELLAKLQKDDPQGYRHFVRIHEGKGHWMDMEDKAALPWMAGFSRDPVPTRVVWKQTGTPHDRSYWLATPTKEAVSDSMVIAQREGQCIDVTAAEKVSTLLVRLDDRMVDFEKPVVVTHAGKELFSGKPVRTIGTMLRTLEGRGDPKLMFDAELTVKLPVAAPVVAPVSSTPVVPEPPHHAALPAPRGYVCLKAAAAPVIDGKLDDDAWNAATWSDDFVDIEGDRKPKPAHRTRMKMLWDDKALYIAAELEEPHIWATLTEHDAVIFHDPDFEVFIDPDGDNHLYGELELNAKNTTWDLLLSKPYRDGGRALNGWEIIGLKTAVQVNGTLDDPADTDKSWTVEIAWPWKGLAELSPVPVPPKDGQQWRINFSRVQWDTAIEDGKYVKVKGKPEHNWVWSPQGAIDMHRPERWGYLQFSEKSQGPVEYRADPAQDVKDLLHEIYYAQQAYHKKHGRYAESAQELSVKHPNLSVPVIKTTQRGFDATLEAAEPARKVWGISNDSRLWSR